MLAEDKIVLLPDYIANQIAAGEVVQRPESVVKELVENSLDADAKEVAIIIQDAGKQLISVLDNGIGMSRNDLELSIKRHATSKIKTGRSRTHQHLWFSRRSIGINHFCIKYRNPHSFAIGLSRLAIGF